MMTKKCPECGSNSWQNPDAMENEVSDRTDIHRVCDDCGQEYYTDVDYGKPLEARGTSENSGGACSYYDLFIECPRKLEPYHCEQSDIATQLELNPQEAVMFKEIWRKAAARQGRRKKGNTPLRGAEKIHFAATRMLQLEKYHAE